MRVALVGDYDARHVAHRAIPEALRLAAEALRRPVEPTWVHTSALTGDVPRLLSGYAAVWCVPASPYANMQGAIDAIRFARESGRPFLGTCGGFQHAVIEYARHVLGLPDADHAETNPAGRTLLVAPLECSLVEKSEAVRFVEGSRLAAIYGAADATGEYHCSFGLNPAYERALFDGGPLKVAARDAAGGAVRAIELDGHPFFIATLFQSERMALRGAVPPLAKAFVAAAADRATS
jgi:CTP synthase (UTP-ammonia lyase)